MEDNFFAMLNHPAHPPLPMTDGNDEVCYFESSDKARAAAETSFLGSAYGCTIFEIGNGV